MSMLAVVNLWEGKVFGSHCRSEIHMGKLIVSICRLSHNGDLDELLQKKEAVNA